MGSHPINLAIRFLLELAALASVGLWGFKQTSSWPKFILAILLPVALAVIWGVFAVPDDPSRSGSAPIPISGLLRLILEIGIFSWAIWSLYDLGYSRLAWIFAAVVLVHYLVSYDRILWLLNQ